MNKEEYIADDEIERTRRLYHELLFAVAQKWPGETRHDTALRYIQERESEIDQRTDEIEQLQKIVDAARCVMDAENERGEEMSRLFAVWNDWFEATQTTKGSGK